MSNFPAMTEMIHLDDAYRKPEGTTWPNQHPATITLLSAQQKSLRDGRRTRDNAMDAMRTAMSYLRESNEHIKDYNEFERAICKLQDRTQKIQIERLSLDTFLPILGGKDENRLGEYPEQGMGNNSTKGMDMQGEGSEDPLCEEVVPSDRCDTASGGTIGVWTGSAISESLPEELSQRSSKARRSK